MGKYMTSFRPQEQLSVHIYNRLDRRVSRFIEAAQAVGYTVAMPLPFAYYHLMCVTLVFNLAILAFVPALYKSWGTIIMFAAAVLVT